MTTANEDVVKLGETCAYRKLDVTSDAEWEATTVADGAMKGHRRPPAGGHARFGGADRLVRQTLRLAADVGRRV
ncbi:MULTISPECIES: hypothetical protein [Corynebacterium]|uniref:hypothetical protein n=1 Tax=Corynebacterium TaxID=1716 RepID=UPI00210919AE|nr:MULTISPECIES: hypothetical protein [Corynebacterium]MCQ4616837.1 hypothetical protein [Corynebacterium pseudogenitalium]MDK8364573.1 hypothetical protein [Corynebacterium sp. UMB10119B]